ncbi:hypothetical protein BDY17DRAFT_252238 [Neohortaea acidophila]|uniref:Hypervirulence associated protein TUDOR domain-containing protein n=1 Tax=Neohortaea acidophila TaxID=245834 RepID=A0A6A6PRY3_9PEZI|nr:uncharacterized protein BDY17DRAFT_252238 [Neohortaea acidophila]KAF2482424.1 hypothetical protein BDY17DRAFT_252238 [Neohortaea acidophila]
MPPKGKYTDPKLREEVKEELKQSDKGGAPGQWSARKAQMMAKEYKKRGGDYTTSKSDQDESQEHLEKWGEEEWQTKEGSANAKKADGTQKRYLPKKAWEKMSEGEKQETEEKKQAGSKKGKQFVGNTGKAKEKRKEANEEEDEAFEERKKGEEDGEDDEEEEQEEDQPKANTGQKRKSTRSQSSSTATTRSGTAAKKQKQTPAKEGKEGNAPPGKVGSKHMDAKEPGKRGSADRLPKKGQAASWKAMPGYVQGKVKEVLTKGKKVDGKDVKASKEDPKIVLVSDASGKICVHKPETCFYD